jgi:sulfite reductase alpha subunit-like flavoprotein
MTPATDADRHGRAIAAQQSGLGDAQARAFIADLKKSGRYQADVY